MFKKSNLQLNSALDSVANKQLNNTKIYDNNQILIKNIQTKLLEAQNNLIDQLKNGEYSAIEIALITNKISSTIKNITSNNEILIARDKESGNLKQASFEFYYKIAEAK